MTFSLWETSELKNLIIEKKVTNKNL